MSFSLVKNPFDFASGASLIDISYHDAIAFPAAAELAANEISDWLWYASLCFFQGGQVVQVFLLIRRVVRDCDYLGELVYTLWRAHQRLHRLLTLFLIFFSPHLLLILVGLLHLP